MKMDENLDDVPVVEFKGGVLEISKDVSNLKEEENKSENKNQISKKSKLVSIWSLLIPKKCISNSENSQNETSSLKAITNLNANIATDYFTFRQGVIESAIKDCVDKLLLEENDDGFFIDNFLLTEINLWDSNKERLILLTQKTLFCIKYDFIALQLLDYKKVSLNDLDGVIIGDIIYPAKSIVPHINGFADGVKGLLQTIFQQKVINPTDNFYEKFEPRRRNVQGIRLMWNKGTSLSFTEKWNPFNENIPFLTLVSHPLLQHNDCIEDMKIIYSVEQFIQKLSPLLQDCNCKSEKKNIILENYLGLSSVIHNRNELGYFKVRGKLSF